MCIVCRLSTINMSCSTENVSIGILKIAYTLTGVLTWPNYSPLSLLTRHPHGVSGIRSPHTWITNYPHNVRQSPNVGTVLDQHLKQRIRVGVVSCPSWLSDPEESADNQGSTTLSYPLTESLRQLFQSIWFLSVVNACSRCIETMLV